MKVLHTLAQWLMVFCLPVLLLSASIAAAVNSQWLYHYGFAKYQVSQTTGLAQPALAKAATGLIRYFNSDEEHINLTVEKAGKPMVLFNPRETAHLKDVKELIRRDYWVALGTLIYSLAYAGVSFFWRRQKYWRSLAQSMLWGSSLTLALMLMLGLATLLNFDQLFLQFHLVSFSNDLWQLDPAQDYLIMLFPQGFWYDAMLFCALGAASLAVILGGVSWGYLWLSRNYAPTHHNADQ